MKHIQSILLAGLMLLATPAFFTSCQEDAPEINYTMNVTVNNDFTQLVEAINNGTFKQPEAIEKLIEAIDKMNADQAAKLQAIVDVINSANASLETKLAAIEAAIKAQTLSLENKFDLLETAIKALPDYSSQLDAIKTVIENLPDYGDKLDALKAAIKALPDYSGKFDAVVAALEAMKTQLEAQGTSQAAIATEIAAVTTAINNLIAEVNAGNTDAAAALAQIIQKLEELKAAIESGGSGTPTFTNIVTLDGVTMPVLSAGIDKSDLEEDNWYDIYLFLSGDKNKYIEIMADGEHHNGKTLDLTRKEDEHDGWYWAVEMRNPKKLFQTFGEPGTGYPVFLSGTLLVKRIGTGTEFEITLKDGKVKGEGEYGDGLEHTVSLDFKGELEFDEF
ncbi:hypothetical protein [Proteiniphilum sp. X52]|uniref:hypothetical protein n=1 Tax=Proteiniphilum sp. X52 TaxID=2382159 RepID=UPI002101106D|nr:hypothetical protein [Proteiniphilum sp. X52]